MSGLKLNYSKSHIISWASDTHDWAKAMARENACSHSVCPIVYLGMPLGANMNTSAAWKPVISKIENKLAAWKVKLLSRAGRLTLIKSVLNSLPIYYMSMFRMPKIVAQKIVKLQRRFFWGTSANGEMAPPMVKWSSIELPKTHGGLGVGNILHKNLMLLFKWWWRYSKCDNSLWKRILRSIYNIKGMKASTHTFQGIKEGMWVQMLKNDDVTSKIRNIVEESMHVRVGDGSSTLFWYDKWCAEGPLKDTFPRLFSISEQKEDLICNMGLWDDLVWTWNLRWRRRLYDWELADVERLNLVLPHPTRGVVDDVIWDGTSTNKFPIKEIGKKIYASECPVIRKEITDIIWKMKVPPRAQLIIWIASMEKLKTGDILIEHSSIANTEAMCPFCDETIESNSHILFSCKISWGFWMDILRWWGVSGVLHNNFESFVLAWSCLVPRRRRGKLWLLVQGCTIWSIWYERNKLKFHNGVRDFGRFIYSLKIRVGIWAKELLGMEISSIPGALGNITDLFP